MSVVFRLASCLFEQDTSQHDGDWKYYKQQSYLQKKLIDQLRSLLEAYGYHLPQVRHPDRAIDSSIF